MGVLFGTDGIRGTTEYHSGNDRLRLTPELALRIGHAAGQVAQRWLGGQGGELAIIGRDGRISGMMLESAVAAGLLAQGLDVAQAGVIPTPAIAFLARHLNARLGVVISASHNPLDDNGVKFFGPDGYKLDDELEALIESLVLEPNATFTPRNTRELGRLQPGQQFQEVYVDYLVRTWRGSKDLSGLSVLLECANGATSLVAPEAFRRLGAAVKVMNGTPDGLNINQSYEYVEPKRLSQQVVGHGADLGVAFDGDGDRVVLVDERGGVVDGDGILAILAHALHRQGRLRAPVVATHMSNYGLHECLGRIGVEVVEAPVGDKFVLAQMRALGCTLGGERSGHILILDQEQTTGDGIYTALAVAAVAVDQAAGRLSELAAIMPRYPQCVESRPAPRLALSLEQVPEVQAILNRLRAALGEAVEVNLRYSGTEDKLRLSVRSREEGDSQRIVDQTRLALQEIVGVISQLRAVEAKGVLPQGV